jgi:hypothetical protein
MTTDLELNKKRLEVKNEINEGINKTPMALLFNITGRLVQKITRYPKPLPFIFCVMVLAIMTLLILGLNYLLLFRTAQTKTQITPISAAILVEIMLVIVAATYFNINMVLSSIRDVVVDSIMSSEDLSKLHEWLSLGWSPSTIRRFFFWWVLFNVGAVTLLYLFFSQEGFSVNLLIPSLLVAVLGGVSFYYVPLMILLPTRLGSFHFKLYGNDPAHSESVDTISTILNRFTYGYVFLNVVIQSSLTIANLPIIAQIAFMIAVGWVPVITQYLVNQACIRTIISRSKRKTLNRIQAEVQSLHEGDVKNKENLEAINRLMDYHERIRATPNSNLNMKIIGNFLNQLALPLLGFLLANIDTIIDLFR